MSAVIQVAALALLGDDGSGDRLLVVRKRGTDRFMLPGGKVESNETPREGLERELREELDLACPDDAILWGRFTAPAANEAGRTVEATVYRARRNALKELTASAEIEEIRWLRVDEPDPDVALAPLLTEQLLPLLRFPTDPLSAGSA